ncbi:MAG: hypothetical protein FIB01_00895 [Gemmatimonadetes bacterium]|nr:hypothetical protein [Gemmatimonadota bacterium]
MSTDAIAMGLNLPIRTVCFSTLEKWDGREDVQLEPWQILQIGGRAGRFGWHEQGFVGALTRRDAERVAQVFAPEFQPPARALGTTVRPGAEHVAVLAEALHTDRLAQVLAAFRRGMSFDSELLAPGVPEDMIALAELADRFPAVPLGDRLTLATAPVDMRQEWLVREYGDWIAQHAAGRPVRLAPLSARFAGERAADDDELQAAEGEARRLTLYAWLGFRFAATFPDLHEAGTQRVALDRFIERTLAQRGHRRRPPPAARAPRARRPRPR